MSDHHHHHADVVVEERVVEHSSGSGMNALTMLLVLVGIAALAWWLFTGPFSSGGNTAPVQNNNSIEQVVPDQPNVQPSVPDVQEPASPGGGQQIPTGWIAPTASV